MQRKGWKVSDTPQCTSFLGLTCVFRLQGLFGFMPHSLAVLLQLVVACLFPWAWTDFQKVPAVYQELQVFITLQTCREKDKTTHVVIHSNIQILFPFERQICGICHFSHHNILFLWRENKQKDYIVPLQSNYGRKLGTHPFSCRGRKRGFNFYVKHKRLFLKDLNKYCGHLTPTRPYMSNCQSTKCIIY